MFILGWLAAFDITVIFIWTTTTLAILCAKKREVTHASTLTRSRSNRSSSSASISAKRADPRRSIKIKETRQKLKEGLNERIRGKPKTPCHGYKQRIPVSKIKPMMQGSGKQKDVRVPTMRGLATNRTIGVDFNKLRTKKTVPIIQKEIAAENDMEEGDGHHEDDVNLEPAENPAESPYEEVVPMEHPPLPPPDEVLYNVKHEALREVPPIGDTDKTTLFVEPPVSIFPTTGGQRDHILRNPRQAKLVYKIKCTNNNDYGVKPVYGFVEPNGSTVITVTRLRGPPKEDKMVIQYVEALAGGRTPEEIFCLTAPWTYMFTTVPLRTVATSPSFPPTSKLPTPVPPPISPLPKPTLLAQVKSSTAPSPLLNPPKLPLAASPVPPPKSPTYLMSPATPASVPAVSKSPVFGSPMPSPVGLAKSLGTIPTHVKTPSPAISKSPLRGAPVPNVSSKPSLPIPIPSPRVPSPNVASPISPVVNIRSPALTPAQAPILSPLPAQIKPGTSSTSVTPKSPISREIPPYPISTFPRFPAPTSDPRNVPVLGAPASTHCFPNPGQHLTGSLDRGPSTRTDVPIISAYVGVKQDSNNQ